MENIAIKNAKEKYENLFQDEKSKAEAFDKLAEKYYFANFGTTSKADLDTLMFSIYIEQILDVSEDNMAAYSDYSLSKALGISQSRISNLKVKKELQYPYSNFQWEKAFARIVDNYRYEDGKIKLLIPDKNLYYEIKNVIENAGGYIEVQLNTNLLQISPEYFIDLVLSATPGINREVVKEKIRETLEEHKFPTEEFERKSVGQILKMGSKELVTNIVAEIIEMFVPVVGKPLGIALKTIVKELG